MTISIRNTTVEDTEACRDLWVVLTQWHRDIYNSPGIGGDDPGAQYDEHLQRVGHENLWVALDHEEVVGLAGLIIDGTSAEVEPVVVRPSHRGRGIGAQLTNKAIERARACGVNMVSVKPVARNKEACSFFRSRGFDTLGHIEMMMDLRTDADDRWTKLDDAIAPDLRC